MRFTVFGATGFIGGALTAHLRSAGHEVRTPSRAEIPGPDDDLGHVVYAIGLTGDFRSRPLDTVDAHVTVLADRIRAARFDSWLYLSSTRVYSGIDAATVSEETPTLARPTSDGIYDLSKLLGEAICASRAEPTVRVARVSNVYGAGAHSDTFLGMLLADVAAGRAITIGEDARSSKDYVAIDDLCRMLTAVATSGRHRLYNLASGQPVTHGEVAEVITARTGITVDFAPGGPTRAFPTIDVSRIESETGLTPARLTDRLPDMLAEVVGHPAPSHP
ncbi:NAD-dependent epimerase/dehydratase family protein [Nocardioides humilatus]|uniref:NAD-dependent epimerase/dehydratase family protein n=1 Tax=Nocardioides humilatus TaxID=2607660 RepID=A0A5B1LGU8_9ACTN|nr:NAD-dependent epimerase/dehydratase family protein [Nocardioides humilatus]KAA1419438.1 NAD-dependent epimerase/dehydratase family protein [Nocardioides humilatus]